MVPMSIKSIRVSYTINAELDMPRRAEVCAMRETKQGITPLAFWIDIPETTEALSQRAIDESMRRIGANGAAPDEH